MSDETNETGMWDADGAAGDETRRAANIADAETTQVPPTPGDEPELAWSVDYGTDDDTDEMSTNRRGRLIWAGLAALVTAITAALVLLLSTLFGKHATNNAEPHPVAPRPVTTTVAVAAPPAPVALPPTVTAPPPAPSAAPASPYATLVGKWVGHERALTVSADGTVEMDIPDFPACPTCSMASMPDATIHVGLTSYNGTPDGVPDGRTFFGYVKDSSDARVIPAGLPVEVDVTNASDYSAFGPPDRTAPGRVLTVTINGDRVGAMNAGHQLGDQVPFCDKAADKASVCGA
jgi:hypothetical protein